MIDSFPVATCQNIRIPRCKLVTGNAYWGLSASKRQWFYGFKAQVIATSDGIPVEFYIYAGSEANITGLRAMAVDLPEGSLLYTNNAYTDYALKDIFAKDTSGQAHDPPGPRQTAAFAGATFFDSALPQKH